MKYELRSIESWRYEDGWSWNNSWHVEDVFFEEPTTRRILRALRDWRCLTPESKGRCTVWSDGDMFEIQDRRTGEPLYALLPIA